MRLKNFPLYLKKIKTWSRASGIRIRKKKRLTCEGVYYPYNKTIAYCSTLSQSGVIACLLHELGHLMDDYTNVGKFGNIHLSQGIDNLDSKKALTIKQKEKLMDIEETAWKNAEGLAKILKIPLGKWYYKEKKTALDTYKAITVRAYK